MDPHEHGAVLGAFEQVIEVGGRVAVATLLVEDAALGSGSFFHADRPLINTSAGSPEERGPLRFEAAMVYLARMATRTCPSAGVR